MENHLEAFLEDRRIRGLKPGSIAVYKQHVGPFLEFVKDKDPRASVFEFLTRYKSDRTRKTAWVHIKVYASWCIENDLDPNWVKGLKFRFAPVAQTPVLSIEEFHALMAWIPNTWQGRRDRAIFFLLFYTGARRTAICQLRHEDVNLDEGVVKIISKRNREQFIPIPEVAAAALKEWMDLAYKHMTSDFVFPSIRHPEKFIDPQYLTHAFPRYARAMGMKKRVYIHLMRHSFATALYEAGTSVETISAALGHADLATTSNYVRRLGDAKRVREAVVKVFGSVEPPAPIPAPTSRAPQRKRRPMTAEDCADWL